MNSFLCRIDVVIPKRKLRGRGQQFAFGELEPELLCARCANPLNMYDKESSDYIKRHSAQR